MLTRRSVARAVGEPRRGRVPLGRALALALAGAVAATPAPALAAPPISDLDVARFGRATASATAAASEPAPAPPCGLLAPGSELATTAECTACHALRRTHPVDLDYARAAAAAPGRLFPADEVVRAGGYLPDGQLRCVTCHDRRSPWRYRIALPPGAVPSPSVATMRAAPGTYPGLRVRTPVTLAPGAEVTPTPLCKLCHVR